MTAFARLEEAYAAVQGEAIPAPPATWIAEMPSEADLQSPFGKLYSTVKTATDASLEASVLDEMNDAATLLGFPAE